MITNEERLNLEARIKELEESCRVKDQKFDHLCKDFDARDAELKRIIAAQRAIIDIGKNFVEQCGTTAKGAPRNPLETTS